jgi:acetyl-CoA carboxylase biotin carboxyl carrier protein
MPGHPKKAAANAGPTKPVASRIDFAELERLIELFEASALGELEIEQEGIRVRLAIPQTQAMALVQSPMASASQVPARGSGSLKEVGKGGYEAEGLATIDAPMVGTFYTSPAPGEPPFVLPGDTVEPGQTVCIVEAMKIMNEVQAKVPGIIEKILVESGDAVEFGQPLFTLRPLA